MEANAGETPAAVDAIAARLATAALDPVSSRSGREGVVNSRSRTVRERLARAAQTLAVLGPALAARRGGGMSQIGEMYAAATERPDEQAYADVFGVLRRLVHLGDGVADRQREAIVRAAAARLTAWYARGRPRGDPIAALEPLYTNLAEPRRSLTDQEYDEAVLAYADAWLDVLRLDRT